MAVIYSICASVALESLCKEDRLFPTYFNRHSFKFSYYKSPPSISFLFQMCRNWEWSCYTNLWELLFILFCFVFGLVNNLEMNLAHEKKGSNKCCGNRFILFRKNKFQVRNLWGRKWYRKLYFRGAGQQHRERLCAPRISGEGVIETPLPRKQLFHNL